MKCPICQNLTKLYGEVHCCNLCGNETRRKLFKYELENKKMPGLNTILTKQTKTDSYDRFMLFYDSGVMVKGVY